MKIVISSNGPDLDSAVDPRFGRAAYYLIVDSEKGELLESIDNSSGMDASQGAGINAAAMLADKGVQAILTGSVGPKAMNVVEKAKIKVISNVIGTVRDSVEQFRSEGTSGPESVTTARGRAMNFPDAGRAPGLGRGMGRGAGGGGRCGGGQGRGQCRRG